MTKAEIRAEVKRYGFGDTDFDDSAINGLIDVVYAEIQASAAWPQSEADPATVAITSGNSAATMPADFSKVRAVTKGTVQLGYISPDDFIQYTLDGTSGSPTHYTIWKGNQLRLYPTPNASSTVTVWFYKDWEELADGDEPIFAKRYHYIIVKGVLARLYEASDDDQGDLSRASLAQREYDARLETMKADLLEVELDRAGSISNDYTLRNIASQVRSFGFDNLADSQLTFWANEVIGEISGTYDWPFLLSGPEALNISQGDAVVTLPADCMRPIKILRSNGEVLKRERMDALLEDSAFDVLNSSGTPEQYSIWGADTTGIPKIRIFPTPSADEALSLWYYKTPTPNYTSSSKPPFPPRHHGVIVWGVLVKAALAANEDAVIARANIFRSEYEKRLEAMKYDLLHSQSDNNDTVVPGNVDGWDY